MSETAERRPRRRLAFRLLRSQSALAVTVAAFAMALILLVVVARPRRPAAPASAGTAEQATVTGNFAELKREASDRSPVVARLAYGARVLVTSHGGRWVGVRSADGSAGFLTAESIETDSEKDAREKRSRRILGFPPVYGVVAEDTDVLLAPFPLAARSGRLRKGTTVEIHAVDHDFYAFRTASGGVAFVNSGDVDIVPPDPRRPAIVPESARAIKDVKLTDLPRTETAPTLGEPGLEPGPGEPESPRGDELSPPVLISKVDPIYPESARRAGVDGTVVLEALISATGQVTEVQVVRGLPLGLSEAAADAVHRWQYRPARGRFGPIPSRKIVRIVFALGD